jgi:hypothetical protein
MKFALMFIVWRDRVSIPAVDALGAVQPQV